MAPKTCGYMHEELSGWWTLGTVPWQILKCMMRSTRGEQPAKSRIVDTVLGEAVYLNARGGCINRLYITALWVWWRSQSLWSQNKLATIINLIRRLRQSVPELRSWESVWKGDYSSQGPQRDLEQYIRSGWGSTLTFIVTLGIEQLAHYILRVSKITELLRRWWRCAKESCELCRPSSKWKLCVSVKAETFLASWTYIALSLTSASGSFMLQDKFELAAWFLSHQITFPVSLYEKWCRGQVRSINWSWTGEGKPYCMLWTAPFIHTDVPGQTWFIAVRWKDNFPCLVLLVFFSDARLRIESQPKLSHAHHTALSQRANPHDRHPTIWSQLFV